MDSEGSDATLKPDTPLAKALQGRDLGETVRTTLPNRRLRMVTVESIED